MADTDEWPQPPPPPPPMPANPSPEERAAWCAMADAYVLSLVSFTATSAMFVNARRAATG